VIQGVRGIWRLLEKPGIINVDFADLCTVTKDKHAESLLAIAEARGENRAREIVDRLLAHPLSDGGAVLALGRVAHETILGALGLKLLTLVRLPR